MIERYSTPEMTALWSEANRYRSWLEVELAATEAWEGLGEVPEGTTARLRAALTDAPLDDAFAERVAEIEARTRHDIVAFTRALSSAILSSRLSAGLSRSSLPPSPIRCASVRTSAEGLRGTWPRGIRGNSLETSRLTDDRTSSTLLFDPESDIAFTPAPGRQGIPE